MAEKPEQVLEQYRTAAAVFQAFAELDDIRHEKAGSQKPVKHHHHRADEQGGKGQQRQNGGNENAPYRQGQAHQCHTARARLQHRHHIVQTAHGEPDDEQRQRGEHQYNAVTLPRRAREDGLRRIERPASTRGPARHKETRHQHQHSQQIDPVTQHVHIGKHHVARADHQRNEVVAKPAQEQRREQVDDHDHAVHRDQLEVGLGRDEGERVRESQLQPHHPRQHQCHQANRYRRDRILDGDDLGVLAPDVFRDEAFRMVKLHVLDFGSYVIVDGVGCHIGHQNTSSNCYLGPHWTGHHRSDTLSVEIVSLIAQGQL